MRKASFLFLLNSWWNTGGQVLSERGKILKLDDFKGDAKSDAKLNILFIAFYLPGHAATIIDHCLAFERHSRHNYVYVNIFNTTFNGLIEPDAFDCIIIHYSVYTISDVYLHPSWVKAIAQSKVFKAMFIQDEYRLVNAFTARMRELQIDALFTCVPYEEIEKVYPESALPNVHKINNLTGYVPRELEKATLDLKSPRPIDVGYRGRDLGFWYGELGQEKTWIANKFLPHGQRRGLKCDISCLEKDRIYGEDWLKFMKSCRCVLGTESGASVFDFTGEIEANVKKHLKKHPDATFEETRELFFKDKEGLISLNQISPRVFESIACGCGLVLFEGRYSDVVVPDRHFIPLKKDFSNVDEVISKIEDKGLVREMALNAFNEIIVPGTYSYRAFAERFDNVMDEIGATGRKVSPQKRIIKESATRLSMIKARVIYAAIIILQVVDPFLRALFKALFTALHSADKAALWAGKKFERLVFSSARNTLNSLKACHSFSRKALRKAFNVFANFTGLSYLVNTSISHPFRVGLLKAMIISKTFSKKQDGEFER